MTNADLIRKAEAAGISVSYLDWHQRRVEVPERTLVAILHALDAPAGSGTGTGTGTTALADPDVLPRRPEKRGWGFAVQLYSVRSRHSWGHGDFGDLAELAHWSGRALGADFILVNPLHAAEPTPPLSDSPYLPMTRRYLSPLYIRVEDIPEYQRLTRQQRQNISEQAGPLRAASRTPDLIDRDQVWAAKHHAFELIFAAGLAGARANSYQRFVRNEGDALRDWATWCALAEINGPDWRRWPAGLADPRRAAAAKTASEHPERVAFHAWLQWIADDQLAQAQAAALAGGMSIGLIADLAVGVHPGGADAWAHQELLVRGISVGAPPDGFNQRGQDWTQAPLSPARLASTRGRPFAELLRAAFRQAGALRMDHVMGLTRLWWIPEGMPPEQGAYVTYDHELMVGTLAAEAVRAGALAIGEDLGTVEPWISRYLADRHVLGTEMAWFARQPDGSLTPPSAWRRWCMATVGTHDVPPVAGFVAGDQVTVRERLGLLSNPQDERKALELDIAGWRDALGGLRLLPDGREPTTQEMTVALYGYLAQTPSVLVGVALADAVGDRRTQNIPGTSSEYPNWRIPLCNGDGESVLIEDLAELPLVRSVVSAASGRLASPRG